MPSGYILGDWDGSPDCEPRKRTVDALDTPTHALIGRLASRAAWPEREGRGLAALATVAGILPDLDVLLPGDSLERLQTHRGITHSFVGAIVGAAVVAWVGRRFGLRDVAYWRAYAATLAGWLLHILFDVFTSYGTMIFEPFSDYRATVDTLFIIDPYLTALAIGALMVGWRWRRNRAAGYRVGLAVMAFYVGFNGMVTGVTLYYRMNEWASQHELTVGRLAALPVPFSPMYRRGVLESGGKVYDMPVTLFGRQEDLLQEHLSAPSDPRLAALWDTRAGRIYRWFSRFPVVLDQGADEGERIELQDVRFAMRPDGLGWLGSLAAEAALDHNPDFFKRRIFTLAAMVNGSGDVSEIRYNGSAADSER